MRRKRERGTARPLRELELDIETLSHEGRGVGRVEGKAVFVHGALPGERVRARVVKPHGSFDEADVIEVVQRSAERIEPRCAHFGVCGGCSLQHAGEGAQLAHKQAVLLELLLHQGKVVPAEVAPAIAGPQWGYRRKARLGVKFVEKKGRILIGFRERAKPYVADCDSCAILDPRVGERLPELRLLIESLASGARIPQIEVAIGDDVVALVLRHLEPLIAADRALLESYALATGFEIFLQSGGPETVVNLRGGREHLTYAVDELRFAFLPNDFTQVNASINQRMVARALELLALERSDEVLDLYCGLGNFTLPIARRARSVRGYEGEPALVGRAAANAALNGISNATFAQLDLADSVACAAFELAGATKLLLDPPRSGAAAVIEHMPLSGIERLVYVSCNPVTFARDAAALVNRHRFRLAVSGILDMFPQTAHVESISLFERR